jgi:phosphoglycerate dehydrogenase-like enzyme
MSEKREIDYIMAAVSYEERHMRRIEQIFSPCKVHFLNSGDSKGIDEALKIADVALVNSDIDSRFLTAPNLKWIHCGHAGLNRSATKELFETDLMVTGAAGRSAPVLAEHAFMFMLNHSYRINKIINSQKLHQWGFDGQNDLKGLYGKTIGIFGLGHTGKEVVRRAKAMNMRILGYNRSEHGNSDDIDQFYSSEGGDGIEEILKESDFIVLSLPLTDKTYHMIGKKEFSLMKETAYIVNMARGAVINEKEMIIALKKGIIAGAGLDTFEQEPLDRESELWDMENVLITPHCTPTVPDRTGASLDILEENVKRYKSNEKMINLLTKADIYTKST